MDAGPGQSRQLATAVQHSITERSKSFASDSILAIETEIVDQAQYVDLQGPLAFVHYPLAHMVSHPFLPEDDCITDINTGRYALQPRHPSNQRYLKNESRLCEMLMQVQRVEGDGEQKVKLENQIYRELKRVRKWKAYEWSQ